MFVFLVFPLIGFLMVVIPLMSHIKTKNNIANGSYQISEGQVVDFKELRDEDGVTYAPIYEFYVNGKTYRCVSKISSSWRSNKPRKIAYDPNNPIDNRVVGANIPLMIFGIIFLVVGIIVTMTALRG